MFVLWMFGAELARHWGKKECLKFYLICGAGAGLINVMASYWSLYRDTATIGASGAIYGLLAAYGILFPNRTIYFYLLFPMPARVFVIIIAAVTFFSSLSASGSNISHYSHLGGLVVAYLYLKRRTIQIAVMRTWAAWLSPKKGGQDPDKLFHLDDVRSEKRDRNDDHWIH